MIASGLLKFRCCCALRLEGNSQVGIIPIYISSEEHIMPGCIIVARLPYYACASMQAPCAPFDLVWKSFVSNVVPLYYNMI